MRAILGLFRTLVGLVLLLALVIVGWGFVEGRTSRVEHHLAPIPGLPPSLEGRQAVVMADLQVGMLLDNPGVIEGMVERIVRARPALVLLPGDLVYGPDADRTADHLLALQRLLQPIPEAGIPAYAVLGHHDYGQGDADDPADPAMADQVAAALEEIGVEVLRNESARLPSGGELYVVGIGPELPGAARPAEALADLSDRAPRIVMMHDPATFRRMQAGDAPFAVAGHTHGGQVAIPGSPPSTWLSAMWAPGEPVADGWVEDAAAGNRLYITRGVGFSVVPLRVFAPPELTWFTLTASEPLAAR